MKNRKGILAVFMAIIMAASIVNFGSFKVNAGNSLTFNDEGKTLTIYCYNEEVIGFAKYVPGYTQDNKYDITKGHLGNVVVNWVINNYDNGDYQNQLDYALSTSDVDVDVFLSEADNVQKYAQPGIAKSMDSLGITSMDLENQYNYTKQLATSGGKQYASSYSAYGGGMIYNREIAKEVLGTDDPAKVQSMVSNWDKWEAVAKKMKKAGYRMTPTPQYILRLFSDSAATPWVSGNKINVSSSVSKWVELSKRMMDAGQTTKADLWDWDTYDAFYNNTDFCVFGPTWYFNFCMFYESGKETVADKGGWAFCEGPQAFFWGSTYLSAAEKTDNPQAAAYLIRMLTTDNSVMKKMMKAEEYYTFATDVNNKTLINKAAKSSSFNNPVLGGQNPYTILKDSNNHIDASNHTVYDSELMVVLYDCMKDYFVGKCSKSKAYDNFFKMATAIYPELSRGQIYDDTTTIGVSLSNHKDGVKLTWKALPGAEKYYILKQYGKGNWTQIGITRELKYIDIMAIAGEKATYSVVGVSPSGNEISAIGKGKSITYIAPAMKTTVQYRPAGLSLSWNAVNGAEKYRIFRKVGNEDWMELATTKSLGYVDTTAVYGKTYTYAVRAMNASGSFISDMGSETSFTYFAPAPKVTLKNGTMGVNISWASMSRATKYRIFVKNSSGAWTKLATIKDGTTYTYTDTKAKVGNNYTYAVVGMDSASRFMNDYGNGTTITREKPVMNFTLKSVAAGVKISWKAADGAGKYRVYRKNSSGSWTSLATIKDGTLFYKDTTAVNGKTYTYAVVAMSAGGTALTNMGDGQNINYVKPVSESEVLEAEVTDVDGNVIVYTISGDEITEDYITIVPEDQEEIVETEGDSEEIEEGIAKVIEETSEDKEDISEDTEETAEDAGTIVDDTDEEISNDSEDVISEDNKEESSEEVIEEETENNSEESSEDAGEENVEEIAETLNSEIKEDVQE